MEIVPKSLAAKALEQVHKDVENFPEFLKQLAAPLGEKKWAQICGMFAAEIHKLLAHIAAQEERIVSVEQQAVILTPEEAEAIAQFFSYGATRGNHNNSVEGTTGPLTPYIASMGSVARKIHHLRPAKESV